MATAPILHETYEITKDEKPDLSNFVFNKMHRRNETTEITESSVKDTGKVSFESINLPSVKLELNDEANLSNSVLDEIVTREESTDIAESFFDNENETLFEAINCLMVKRETKVESQEAQKTLNIVETNHNEELSSSCELPESTNKGEKKENIIAKSSAVRRNTIFERENATRCGETGDSSSFDTIPQDWSIRRIMNTFGVSHSTATKARHYRRRTDMIAKQRVQQSSINSKNQHQPPTNEYFRCQSEDMASDISGQNSGGRPKSKIVDFYTYDMEQRKAYCRLKNCTYSAKIHTGNQTRHMLSVHPDEYKEFTLLSQDIDSGAQSSTDIDDYKRLQTYTLSRVSLTADIIKEGILQMVTVNGRPFEIVDDSGFRLILDPLLDSLPKHDRLIVNKDSIKYIVNEESKRMKNIIKDEVKKCGLVSLKVDAAARNGRYFLGVNIQFIRNEEVFMRTLGIVEITDDQRSGDNLKKIIIDIFESFDIGVTNIYTFTSDNASSMIKILSSFNENEAKDESTKYCPSFVKNNEIIDSEDNDYVNDRVDPDIDGTSDELPKIPEEQDLAKFLNVCTSLEAEQLEIKNIPCAALTLQYAIEDAIAMTKLAKLTTKARAAVKYFCKTETMMIDEALELLPNIAKPKLDSPTRWHSTYDMFDSLLALRDRSALRSYLNDCDWRKLEEYVTSLKPAKIATVKLQSQQLLLTDFYVTWLSCAAQTKRIDGKLAKNIVICMEKRQIQLFSNDSLLAAIFLDPLTNAALLGDLKIRATKHLLQIWERLGNLRSRESSANVKGGSNDEQNESIEIPKIGLDDDVVMFLNEARKINKNTRCVDNTVRDIRPQLQKFFDDENRAVQENLLKYWERNKFIMPELYKLSKIILGAPASQISLERLYSGLIFACSPSRRQLSDDDLNNVLVVRSNYKEFGNNFDNHTSKKKRRKDFGNLESDA